MADSIAAGETAPVFTLPSTHGDVSLETLLREGKRVVLAFYVEDSTPGCQTELALLRDAHEMLAEFGAAVVAVSADSVESHRDFAERMGGVPFPLASDQDASSARAYGVGDPDDPRRSRRALFVIERDGRVLLAMPHFQPTNLSQVEAVFAVLGQERW